jgi:hypothetical protein
MPIEYFKKAAMASGDFSSRARAPVCAAMGGPVGSGRRGHKGSSSAGLRARSKPVSSNTYCLARAEASSCTSTFHSCIDARNNGIEHLQAVKRNATSTAVGPKTTVKINKLPR